MGQLPLFYGCIDARAAPWKSALEDVATPFTPFTGKMVALDCTDEGGDGYQDLTLGFDSQDVVEAIEKALGRELEDGEEVIVDLTAELSDGTLIVGDDVVVILKEGK